MQNNERDYMRKGETYLPFRESRLVYYIVNGMFMSGELQDCNNCLGIFDGGKNGFHKELLHAAAA
jgi:hypothetical protein